MPKWLLAGKQFKESEAINVPITDQFFSDLEEDCIELELTNSLATIRRIRQTITRPRSRKSDLVDLGPELQGRLLDEMSGKCFLALSAKERELYESHTPLFGVTFQTKFSTDGAFELDEASKCLALGRATAAVFHLMRLMEIAVRAVARCLNIPDPIQPADRSWGAVLKKVRDGIDAKWPTVATRLSGDGEIFDALYASLDAVKNPWRNSTMHPANKYTVEEAEHVLAAVRGFVMKLASRCDENGDPKA